MALGVHVACGFVGASGFGGSRPGLIRRPQWSQSFASGSPGVTGAGASNGAGVAPAASENYGQPVFEVTSAVDIVVAIGPNADATSPTQAKIFVKGDGSPRNLFAEQGDKLSWAPA